MPSLEETVGDLLRARKLKLVIAESCTGGLVGDRITNFAGSSEYFLGGIIAYAYEAKTALLGVPRELLLQHGAVSEKVARAMVRGARKRLDADIALALTGIMGPGGETPSKPVGLVYIALATGSTELCRKFLWHGTRIENKNSSATAALTMLKDYLVQTA